MITKESLRILHNNLVFVKGINRQYSDRFANTGAKIGSTIDIRMPNRYYVSTGPALQVQGVTETSQALTIDKYWHIGMDFTTQDLTLTIDEFSKRYIQPAMAVMASKVDYDCLAMAYDVYNQVGTPGSVIGTNTGTGLLVANMPTVALNAGMQMTNFCTPKDMQRRIVVNPAGMAGAASSGVTWFNSQAALAEIYKAGVMGRAHGFEWAEDQNVRVLTCGTRTNGTINGAGQSGATLNVTGLGANATVKKGEVFTIALVNAVNPENQQNTGNLAYFTVTADSTATAGGVIAALPISPSIVVSDGGVAVANGTVTVAPPNGAAVTWMSGTASTGYPQNLAYYPDAFTLATADLEMPKGVDFAARESYDGISMRIIRQYDINSDNLPCRIDVIGGMKTLRPEFACRICG